MDGATGTMIQQHNLTEDDYRGGKDGNFIDFSAPKGERELFLKGNNELLSLTQPQIIKKIHEDYLDAGADIMRATTEQGVELVMQKQFDINTQKTKYRWDTLFGVAMVQPEMAGIMLFSQT